MEREGKNRSEYTTIPVSEIKTNEKYYLRSDSDVDDLVESIENIGLISPLVINIDKELLAGSRRLAAVKRIGLEKVPVLFVEHDDDHQELLNIDENIVRMNLDDVEMDRALARRKVLYEKLYPEALPVTTPGRKKRATMAKTATVPLKSSFVKDTSRKTGIPERTVRQKVARDEKQSEAVAIARQNKKISNSQTDELIKLPKEYQDKALPFVTGKDCAYTKTFVETVLESGIDAAIAVISHPELTISPSNILNDHIQNFKKNPQSIKSAKKDARIHEWISDFCSKANVILVELQQTEITLLDHEQLILMEDLKAVHESLGRLIAQWREQKSLKSSEKEQNDKQVPADEAEYQPSLMPSPTSETLEHIQQPVDDTSRVTETQENGNSGRVFPISVPQENGEHPSAESSPPFEQNGFIDQPTKESPKVSEKRKITERAPSEALPIPEQPKISDRQGTCSSESHLSPEATDAKEVSDENESFEGFEKPEELYATA